MSFKSGYRVSSFVYASLGLFLNIKMQVALSAEGGSRIIVLVHDFAQVPRWTMAGAQKEATRIFSEIGVAVSWIDCSATESRRKLPAVCSQRLDPTQFVLRIHDKFTNAGGVLPDATLGFALLSTDHRPSAYTSVFYDRVKDLAANGPASHAQVLGHGIAHELGHMLLGDQSHSPYGLMRARWSREDLRLATVERLNFTRQEAERIRAAVQLRANLKLDR